MRLLIAAVITVIVCVLVFVCVFIAEAIQKWWHSRKLDRRTGRDVVIRDIYVERAKENYLLLDKTIDYLRTLVAADDVMATLTEPQRNKAEKLIVEFNKNQLPKGK